ncbi:MAG TPA: ATP-binding protein [Acetobacteraceae bacterium]|nr:ATP-binding protein [Acetobacteraceae bacterium]
MLSLRPPPARRFAILLLAGLAALAAATWICFELGTRPGTAGLIFLAIIVVLSPWDSFVSSAIFSLVAVAALNYFFTEPLFSFRVQYGQDLVLLGTFILTSFVITALVQRLQHAAATLERQAKLLDLTHDTIFARNHKDIITFWNRGAAELYGWSSEEALGQMPDTLLKTVLPEPREAIDDILRRTGHWEGDLINTRKDGTQVIVASRWSLQRDANGRPTGTLQTNNDITERRQAEEALRRSQAAYLAEAQKLSLTGSFGWNTRSGEVFWSQQTFAILGYGQDVRPSIEAMLERVHPDDAETVRQALTHTSTDRGGFDMEFRLRLPDSAIRQVHAVARVLEAPGDPAQIVGALMDVTAAWQSEIRLQQAQAQIAHVARITSLGALSASIAHEVNQPLAGITAHGEASLRWLHRDVPRLDEVEASIRHVIADAKRASAIIQRIRALTTRSDQERQPLNLNDLVNEVVPLVRNEARRNRAQVRLDLGTELPAVLGDPIQLQQVIINLLVNAIQAMQLTEGGSHIAVVGTRADGDGHVVLDVADSGPGVDPAHSAQLFDAFYTTKPGGMGMGLSICRSIVEAHGGTISAMSRSPEQGAVFRCVLPVVQAA